MDSDIISLMENIDGYLFICKLCGKEHEVPEQIAPYWRGPQTLGNIPIGELTLGCAEKPEQTEQYAVSDLTPFKVTP